MEIHPAHEVDTQRRANIRPLSKSDKTAKVSDDGTLKVTGVERRTAYVATAKVGKKHAYVQFQAD